MVVKACILLAKCKETFTCACSTTQYEHDLLAGHPAHERQANDEAVANVCQLAKHRLLFLRHLVEIKFLVQYFVGNGLKDFLCSLDDSCNLQSAPHHDTRSNVGRRRAVTYNPPEPHLHLYMYYC